MTTNARRRLLRDLRELKKEAPQGIMAAPLDSNILQWKAVIFGPPGTPFEDGIFKLSMKFTEEYPDKSPTVTFVTPVYHPNSTSSHLSHSIGLMHWHCASLRFCFTIHCVCLCGAVYTNGNICLDILQNQWRSTYSVAGVLTSIQSLLDEPNTASPANADAAHLFQTDRVEYERKVHECVEASWIDSRFTSASSEPE
eukprot:m.48783 g.48783  ORF g.48783 m.48783 type:complete len:197 (+) comp11060_c0_seq2:252-842(+)